MLKQMIRQPYWIVLMLVLLSVSKLEASNFVVVGTRATGMAGASVAIPEGAYSIYWNPARMEKESENSWSVIFPTVGYHAEQHNHIFKRLDDILDILGDYDLSDDEISNDHIAVQRIRNILYDLDRQGTGLVVDAHAGCLFKKDKLMLGFLSIAYGGLAVDIDTENLSVGDETQPNSIEKNHSSFDSWGLWTHQFIGGYQFPMYDGTSIKGYHNFISFGFTLKYIYGQSYSYYRSVYDKDVDDDDKKNPFRENRRSRGTVSYDLGFHYKLEDFFEAGLVFRDCSSPIFPRASHDFSPDETIRLRVQTRLGLAYHYDPDFTVALDFDLSSNNSSTLDGYKDQRVALGLEKAFFNRHLLTRLGYYQNVAESGSDSVVTVGLGTRIGLFFLEASFGITPRSYGTEHVLFIDETIGSFHISFFNPPTQKPQAIQKGQ
ncbi:conjugal transfer protein TraF [bacterium]|nr:conjugal transfer protein TraF [bacterium]